MNVGEHRSGTRRACHNRPVIAAVGFVAGMCPRIPQRQVTDRRKHMPSLSTADHRASPPRIHVPRDYNAAHDLIERNLAAGRAAKTAYIDDAGAYTYGDLAERVNRCANALIALGLRPEERVLLCHLDTIDFPAVFLGAIKAGIVPIAANTLLTTADYDYMLRDSRAARSSCRRLCYRRLLRYSRSIPTCRESSFPARSARRRVHRTFRSPC